MLSIMLYGLFFVLPVVLVIHWCVSLWRFVSAKKKNKQTPGAVSPEEMDGRKTTLITISLLAGLSLTVSVGFLAIGYMAIANM